MEIMFVIYAPSVSLNKNSRTAVPVACTNNVPPSSDNGLTKPVPNGVCSDTLATEGVIG